MSAILCLISQGNFSLEDLIKLHELKEDDLECLCINQEINLRIIEFINSKNWSVQEYKTTAIEKKIPFEMLEALIKNTFINIASEVIDLLEICKMSNEPKSKLRIAAERRIKVFERLMNAPVMKR